MNTSENITKEKAIEIVTKTQICDTVFTIDPGRSNGAIVKQSGNKVESWNMNKIQSFDDLCDFFRYQREICKLPLCFLEKITTFQSDTQSIGRMFQLTKLKDHYVEIRSALRTNNIPFIEVMPLQWQKGISIYIPGEDYQVRKKRYKDIAKEIFKYVNIPITLQNCDALLLLHFARMKLKRDHLWIHQHIQAKKKTKLSFK